MVDGSENKHDHVATTAVDAELTPEDRERGARLNSMPWEELRKIGRQAYEERRLKESFAEIP